MQHIVSGIAELRVQAVTQSGGIGYFAFRTPVALLTGVAIEDKNQRECQDNTGGQNGKTKQ